MGTWEAGYKEDVRWLDAMPFWKAAQLSPEQMFSTLSPAAKITSRTKYLNGRAKKALKFGQVIWARSALVGTNPELDLMGVPLSRLEHESEDNARDWFAAICQLYGARAATYVVEVYRSGGPGWTLGLMAKAARISGSCTNAELLHALEHPADISKLADRGRGSFFSGAIGVITTTVKIVTAVAGA